MNMSALLDEAERLMADARFSYGTRFYIKTERCLVELRELLDSQPELEAGGAGSEGSSSNDPNR